MVKGMEAFRTLAAFMVMVPVLLIFTPPVAAKGVIHSAPAFLEVAVLYINVALVPYVGAAETVAVPSIETIPTTVQFPVVSVFVPELEKVRLLKVVADADKV